MNWLKRIFGLAPKRFYAIMDITDGSFWRLQPPRYWLKPDGLLYGSRSPSRIKEIFADLICNETLTDQCKPRIITFIEY
jgi:hypothetical protein